MQLYPTSNAVHVAIAGVAVMGAGLLLTQPAVLAWGGAMLVGLAVARAATLIGVSRVRAAGFEMLWRETGRARRIARGQTLELAAEVRNRDTRAAGYVALRAVASPYLDIEIAPTAGEVPAGGRLAVSIRVRGLRVGRHGVYGLSLEVRGSPGLFEIPLTFANPFGIEVMPAPYATLLQSARGGRSRRLSEAGRTGPISGDGYELREIREHRAGDPLKRVAWKASARRGKLMVRDHEQEERDVVWLVLDASVELWAGEPGSAPLDHAIDEVAAVLSAHLGAADQVGLIVCGGRVLSRVPPARSPSHFAALMAALANGTSTLDADRSGLDADDVAVRVLEHLRPLDPAAASGLGGHDREELVRRALGAAQRAPFPPLPAEGSDATDRALRGYLSAFGIPSPPKLERERPRTDATLARALADLALERPRPSLVYVWSPAPDPARRAVVTDALASHARRRVEFRWVRLRLAESMPRFTSEVGRAAAHAVALRAETVESVGERALRRMGVTIERIRPLSVARTARTTSPDVKGGEP
jgi:uncharacterized protein (DUF58 family)